MVHRREDPDALESELDPRNGRQYGSSFAFPQNGNGSAQKIVWAAAGFAFVIAAALVGSWMSQTQADVSTMKAEVARIEEHVEFLQREVDRLRK